MSSSAHIIIIMIIFHLFLLFKHSSDVGEEANAYALNFSFVFTFVMIIKVSWRFGLVVTCWPQSTWLRYVRPGASSR